MQQFQLKLNQNFVQANNDFSKQQGTGQGVSLFNWKLGAYNLID